VAGNYGITLEVKTRAEKLDKFNNKIAETQRKVTAAGNAILRKAEIIEKNAIPNIQNFGQALNDANKAFREAASGTPQATRAAEDFVKATKLVNEELARQNQLLEDVRQKQIKKPVLQNKFTTTSSPFAPSRDPLGRTDAEINRMLDQRAEDVMRVQNALKPTLQGTKLQQRENAEINRQLDKTAELYMIQNKEIKDIANTIRTKKIKQLEAEAKIENEILNAKAKQVQADMDAERKRRSRISIERKQDLLESPGGRFARFRRGRTRGDKAIRARALQNALIGGAFPLLFGQGLAASAGGGLGGGAGGILGGQFGFGLSLVGTSVGAAIDRLVVGLKDFGKALDTTDGALKLMIDRNLFSSKAIQKQAEALKRQGRQAELNELITRDLGDSLGAVALEDVQKFSSEMEELSRQFGILTTQFQLLAAGPLSRVISILNDVTSRQGLESRIGNQLRALKKGDPKEFNKFIKNNPRTAQELGLGLISQTLKQKTPLGLVDTDIGPGRFKFAGRSDEQLKGITTNLGSLLTKLGISSSGIGKNNLEKQLEVFQTEAGNLRLKRDALQSSFSIESAIEVVKKNNKGLDEEQLNLLTNKVREQLKVNEKLEIENHQLQITLDLYNNIASSIENGIVSAIEGAINGTKTLGDVARSVFSQIQRSLISFGVDSLLGSLPGGLGKAFRGGKADGGPVKKGNTFLVGERGPELFTPGVSGMITPNHALGGSTNVVVNVDASGSSVEGDEQSANEFGEQIAAAVQAVIINEKRVGGLLS